MSRCYTVLLEWDAVGPGYVVTLPALPGCFAQGSTVPESLERAREAVTGHIAALIETGQEVPTEDTPALITAIEVEDVALASD